MNEIEWVEEIPGTPGARLESAKFDGITEQLKANPGRWALVAKSTTGSVKVALVKRGCEVALRTAGAKGRFDTYARWPE